MKNFYVTTPIYYVNDLPHLGHIFTTIVADTVARYRRMAGDNVCFLTGTDEHGQNIERAAVREGVEPIALADRVVERYHALWRTFGISHSDFIRTTEPRHRRGVEELIRRIEAAGDFYVARHEGWYCPSCETFYTEKELLSERRCPTHERATEWQTEENVFFRLSKYQQPLLDWLDANPQSVQPESRHNEVRSFVESGLRDLSVSRSGVSWGLPFPGHPGHTVYVWLDALTNYLSALGFGEGESGAERYGRFWSPEATRLHLVGKDIIRHHCVYWPAFLLSAGLPLPSTVWAHGWWLRDQKKMSKSTGNVVRPDELVSRFGPDALRYFLLREMVFGQDASFSDEAFVDRFNSDLANDLGNTASRVVTLARQAFEGRTPPLACHDNPLIAVAREAAVEYCAAMDQLAFQRALQALWRLLAEANQYLVSREPWKLIKSEGASDKLSRVLWNGLEAVRIVATGLLPVMPATAARVLASVGVATPPATLDALAWGGTPIGADLPPAEPLFPRIDKKAYLADLEKGKEKKVDEPKTTAPAPVPATPVAPAASAPVVAAAAAGTATIDIEQFFATDLRIATVTAAERVPKSEKLLKLAVDLGSETRTVVAGIGKEYAPEQLVGRQVVVVANLKPAKLMGIPSQGMVLAASVDGAPCLLHPASTVPNGTRVK